MTLVGNLFFDIVHLGRSSEDDKAEMNTVVRLLFLAVKIFIVISLCLPVDCTILLPVVYCVLYIVDHHCMVMDWYMFYFGN